MRIVGKESLPFGVRLLADLLIAANILCLIFLPPILKYLFQALSESYLVTEDYFFMLVFLYVCGTLSLGILVPGHLFLRNLEKRQPFDRKNPRYFRWLALAFLLMSAAFFVKMFLYNTLLTVFCAFLFLIFALLALILAEVFRQAGLIWEEHELTI